VNVIQTMLILAMSGYDPNNTSGVSQE